MIRSLYTAATGMSAQQVNMDVTANNLANVNTTGFKKSRADFQDLLYQTIRVAGATQGQGVELPTGVQVGLGTRLAATQKVFTQGDFQTTGNELDMVIEGKGFFQVTLPSGEVAYTRDGSLKMDGEGRVVTSDGYPIDPEISIPSGATSISVGKDGTVSVKLAGQTEPEDAGQIQLVNFLNPAGLESMGGNLYRVSAASGEPIVGTPGQDGLGTLAQGTVEMSNVKVVEEMVNLIIAQRAYEVNSKAIQASDEMLSLANNIRR